MADKPVIAVTMGDPAGIGPEVVLKALAEKPLRKQCRPLVVGDLGVMARASGLPGIPPGMRLVPCGSSLEVPDDHRVVPVLDLKNVPEEGFAYGTVRTEYGRAAGEAIEHAVRLVAERKAEAVVTAPIHKESFRGAGFTYPGHTEMLAALTRSPRVSLMLMLGNFRVVHATMHVSLKDALGRIKREKVLEVIRTAHEGCMALGIERPRIGVAGLNPHCGEGGLFGDEERKEIAPAVKDAAKEGIGAEGPYPADSIYALLRGGKFDIVVAMYHDQGGIPVKLLSFDWDESLKRWRSVRGVNVSLGLRIIRTSVAHGTGFEIAGRGLASPASLIEAIETACLMVQVKRLKG